MSTRAVSILKQKKIPFDLVKYDHQEKGAEFAAQATGYPLECTVKTLVVEVGQKHYCLVLLPGHLELDLKKLAACLKAKRTAMVDIKTAERLTGYRVGGISPFGTTQKLPTIMDIHIPTQSAIVINAGQRGVMLKMAPDHIIEALACQVAAIARNA